MKNLANTLNVDSKIETDTQDILCWIQNHDEPIYALLYADAYLNAFTHMNKRELELLVRQVAKFDRSYYQNNIKVLDRGYYSRLWEMNIRDERCKREAVRV